MRDVSDSMQLKVLLQKDVEITSRVNVFIAFFSTGRAFPARHRGNGPQDK